MRKPQLSLLAVSVSVASLLLASTTSFAAKNYKENYKGEMPAPCPIELTLKDGLYIGLQAGYDSYRLATDTTFTTAAGTISVDPIYSASGAVGGGFIGYGMYFPNTYNLYLGAEVFGNWSGAKSDFELFTPGAVAATTDVFKADYKVKSNYGIDAIPGIKINNATLFYLRLGYNWANFSMDNELIADGVTTTNDESQTVGGFHYGLGIESTFYDNWSVRAEYTHTDFNNFSAETVVAAIDSEVHPADNQFMLGILYHFNM